jgi:hypothetical protein
MVYIDDFQMSVELQPLGQLAKAGPTLARPVGAKNHHPKLSGIEVAQVIFQHCKGLKPLGPTTVEKVSAPSSSGMTAADNALGHGNFTLRLYQNSAPKTSAASLTRTVVRP